MPEDPTAVAWGSALAYHHGVKASSQEHNSPYNIFRLGLILTFTFVMLWFVMYSWRWPLIWDMQVMHYVSFLMDRGWAPYRQIWDMNMPGAYLFEQWALHLFGNSDMGWRLWDFTLCGVLTAGAVSIARPYDWVAGFVAAGSFILIHGAEGPENAGQREQVIATLLVVGTALLFESVRRRRAYPMFFFGLAVTLAATIKPTVAVFGPPALLFALRQLRREGVRAQAYVLWALGGGAVAGLLVLRLLVHFDSMGAFVHLLREAVPHYAGITHPAWWKMLAWTLQSSLWLYIAFVLLALGFTAHRLWNWEQTTLLLGIATGLVNFYVQHKGFFIHRYTTIVFVFLWATIQLVPALRSRGAARVFAFAALAVLLLNLPRNLQRIRTQPNYDYFSSDLEGDLERLGPNRLQGKVQCLDIVDGCLNALFHLQIVQSTGSTGDLLLFLQPAGAVLEARTRFLQAVNRDPPEVYVLSNWEFGGTTRTYHKIDAWPAFREMLATQYVLVSQREFPIGGTPAETVGIDTNSPGYRLYVRRGSPLLAVGADAGGHTD